MTGKSLTVYGTTTLTLKLGPKYHISHQFLVAEVTQGKMILGIDLLRKHGLSINLDRNVIENFRFKIPIYHKTLPCRQIATVQTNQPNIPKNTNSTPTRSSSTQTTPIQHTTYQNSIIQQLQAEDDSKSRISGGEEGPKTSSYTPSQVVPPVTFLPQTPPTTRLKTTGYFIMERNTSSFFLVDSGAVRSIISNNLITPTSHSHLPLFSCSNNRLQSNGKVTFSIDLGLNRAFLQTFEVVENSHTDAILGLDFLQQFNLTIHCDSDLLRYQNCSAPLVFGTWPSTELQSILAWEMREISRDETTRSISTWRACKRSNHLLSNNQESVNLIGTPQLDNDNLETSAPLGIQCDELLRLFPGILETPTYHVKPKHNIVLDITLTRNTTINHKARPCPPMSRQFVSESFKDMTERNILQRSTPSHTSPITLVKRNNGKMRICVDYTKLNIISEDINYPLPRINDLTSIISPNHKYFSVLDLSEAYFSLPLTKRARSYAGIITHEGAYKPNRTQFGLKNAPFKFCQLMDEMLGDLRTFVFTYLDDIIVFSETEDQHLRHLEQVFCKIEEFGLFVNHKKCSLGQTEVLFLGRRISQNGVSVREESKQMVSQQHPPSTLRGLRGFLGLINHYRPHLPNLAHLADPLFKLLGGPSRPKRAPIQWNDQCKDSFNKVIQAVNEAVTLGFDDTTQPIIISSDASKSFAGATLEQETSCNGKVIRRPLAFFSKRLPMTTKTRSTFNRELCALRMACQQFRHRIRGRKLIIYTDNSSLTHALTNSSGTHSPVEMGWIAEIKEYAPVVCHIRGALNTVPDFLSRPEEPLSSQSERKQENTNIESTHQVASLVTPTRTPTPTPLSPDLIAWAQQGDCQDIQPPAGHVINVKEIANPDDTLRAITGVEDSCGIFRPYVPANLRPLIFYSMHNPAHLGGHKTYEAVSSQYHWPSLRKDILHWSDHCPECQKNKITRHNRQRLHQFPENKGRMNIIHIDLVGPLPNINNFPYILTMRDRNSGFLVATALRSKVSEGVVRAIEQKFIDVFGLPDTFISDQGTEFTSHVFKNFCQNLGIRHSTTNAGHPQANGQVERIHRTLKTCIRSLNHPANWDKHLPYITFSINNRVIDQNSFTPFQMVFGKPGRSPGVLITDTNPELPLEEDVRLFLDTMLFHHQERRPLPDNKPFIEKHLLNAKSVWVRDETHSPLAPLYRGPYEILVPGEKTFILNINGKPRAISIDRVKAHRSCPDLTCLQSRSPNITFPHMFQTQSVSPSSQPTVSFMPPHTELQDHSILTHLSGGTVTRGRRITKPPNRLNL